MASQVHPMECSLLVSLNNNPKFLLLKTIETSLSQGPISESDFFTWEALICGPKDTPFVSIVFLNKLACISDQFTFAKKIKNKKYIGRWSVRSQADICMIFPIPGVDTTQTNHPFPSSFIPSTDSCVVPQAI